METARSSETLGSNYQTTLCHIPEGRSHDAEKLNIFFARVLYLPIPLTKLSQAWVCGLSLAGIVGSTPAGGMDVCLF
jgi:hypothetical protein